MLRAAVLAVLTLSSLALPAAPAAADSTPPRLVSAERSTPAEVAGGALVALAFDVSDAAEPGSGFSYIRFSFENRDAAGALLSWVEVDGYGDARLATRMLTPWAARGRYLLDRVTVTDRIGNDATYLRDGTVLARPAGEAPPPSGLDFAALDFSVVNPLSDTAAPTVAELRPLSRTVRAGEPIVLTSTPDDDLSGLGELAVSYESPSGVTPVTTGADPVLAAAGLTSGVLPFGAEGGTWRATVVRLQDRAGNGTFYFRDGRGPIHTPSGVRPHAPQPTIDFAALDVDVIAGTPDAEAPTLTDLRREGPATLRRGDDVAMSFTTHDDNPLLFVSFSFQDSAGHDFTILNQCRPERGVAIDRLDLGLELGRVTLYDISLVDSLWNVRHYHRDGTVTTQGREGTDPVPGFDLSAFEFEIVDGAPAYSGQPHTRFGCPSIPKLPVTVPEAADPGTVVDVVGQVLDAADVPLPAAAVAVFAEPAGQAAELVGVVATDATGRYAVSDVMPSSDTTYRARFLGRDGAAGAQATTSAPQLVRAGSSESAPSVSVSPATVSAGEVTTVTYRGTPGATVEILSRTQPATAFSRIGSVLLDASGVGTSTHKPQKNTRITARTSHGQLSADAPLVTVRSVVSGSATRVGTRTYTFSGRSYPALSNRLVSIYRNGVLVAQGRCDSSGVYRVTKTLAAGTFTFQARTGNDAHNLGSVGPQLRLTIR